jgi:hypothetical protein
VGGKGKAWKRSRRHETTMKEGKKKMEMTGKGAWREIGREERWAWPT